ncbi:MAG: 1-acyl-sn-glycerol-3-phosphate acyltransferase [Nitratireductor sp.]|nr:1-acyl-sn-glycerol-3-phosphate acyltransferase [Nitratireductor sp.]
MATLRLALILAVLLPVTLVLAPVQLVLKLAAPKASRRIPLLWHRLVLWLLGVRVHLHGAMAGDRPLMIAANHISWSDILVLGSIGELCFIAKDEVRGWPVINWLARLQRTVFVDRQRKRDAAIQADTIASRLTEGDVMVLFAEGTTGDGNQLLAFKSALFAAPQMALEQSGLQNISVQPVAIAYNTLHGMPLGRYHQPIAAWPGDVAFGAHFMRFLHEGAFDVDVAFGPVIEIDAQSKRKDVARQCERFVRGRFAILRRLHHRA